MLLLTAAVTDLRSGRISNRLICLGLIAGLILQIWESGWSGSIRFVIQVLFPVIVLFLLFLMRALGAGDIKLFSVVSGIWNLKVICYCMFFSFLAGALVSLGKLLFYKNLGARLRYFCYYVWLSLTEGHIGIYDRGISEKETIIHFSVAILIGFLISIGVII
ncbi:MAG: hypothetical protein HFI42_04890 [Lachnospiraceae bacterium]|nr:hypothetical protein [Lachnospiraceae bacterium]